MLTKLLENIVNKLNFSFADFWKQFKTISDEKDVVPNQSSEQLLSSRIRSSGIITYRKKLYAKIETLYNNMLVPMRYGCCVNRCRYV